MAPVNLRRRDPSKRLAEPLGAADDGHGDRTSATVTG